MNIQRYLTKLQIHIDYINDLSKLSTCKRHQCGAAIVSPNFEEVLAIGYNGQPSGIEHDRCTGEEGNCGCVHAELNTLLKAQHVPLSTLLTTTAPCQMCASAIINFGSIDKVIFCEPYRNDNGLNLLLATDIGVHKLYDRVQQLRNYDSTQRQIAEAKERKESILRLRNDESGPEDSSDEPMA